MTASAKAMVMVLNERDRQDERHGPATERGYTHAQWFLILSEEVGEVAKAINDSAPLADLADEVAQVAAVALAMLEAMHGQRHEPLPMREG
jgi:NTP pyrophosphatase (non-canonical NTP hydrolase)